MQPSPHGKWKPVFLNLSGKAANGVLVTVALLLSTFLVVPGLFDTTLTARLAVFPLSAVIVLLAGRRSVPRWAVIGGSALCLVPLLGTIWAPVPLQSVLPSVRWMSFGLMVAGAAGVARTDGTRSIWITLLTVSVAAAMVEIAVPGDLPWGNPNRPGILLAAGFLISMTGAASRRVMIRLPAAVLTGTALLLTSFIAAMAAAAIGVLWYLIALRRSFHPGYLLLVLLGGQMILIGLPGIAERVAPTLELRCRIWKAGSVQLTGSIPLGTGTGQSRLTLMQDSGERAQALAGDPDRRIDHLHSDVLTPVVEWGIAGLLILFLAGLRIAGKRFSPAEGAILVCVWIILAVDLPLATPLGALPAALCLGAVLTGRKPEESVRIPLPIIIMLLVLSLVWSIIIIRGYRLLEQGRIAALSSAVPPGETAEIFRESTSLIPFEERGRLFMTRAYMDAGNWEEALLSAETFNSIYPGYWRGWVMQAEAQAATGRPREASVSYLNALRTAPVTLHYRNVLALNAAAFPPEETDDLVFLAENIISLSGLPPDAGTETLLVWYGRIMSVAESLPPSRSELSRKLETYIEAIIARSVDPEDYPWE